MGLSGQVAENTNAQAGELIGAKAIISEAVVFLNKKTQSLELKKRLGRKESS